MKRLLAVLLCLSLLLGSMAALAEGGAVTAPRTNVTDTDPPEIISFTLKENKKTLKPGSVLHTQLKLDDRSGIEFATVQFYNKSAESYISYELFYDPKTDLFAGEFELTSIHASGSYVLNWLYARDKYGNTMYRWSDKGFAGFKLSGGTSAVKATVTVREKTVKAEEPVHVEVKTASAVKNAGFAAVVVWRDGCDIGYWHYLDKVSSTKYEGSLTIDKEKGNGKYVIKEVIFCTENGMDLCRVPASASFTVTGATDDNTPPELVSVVVKEKGKTLKGGDTVHVSIKVRDKSPISQIDASFTDSETASILDEATGVRTGKFKGGLYINNMQYNESSKKWEGSLKLPNDLPDGKYHLVLYVYDRADNRVYKDLTKQYFSYRSPDYVDDGMKTFLGVCWRALWNREPAAADLSKYGKPLASGSQKAVDVILTLVKKSGLSGEAAAKALWQIMQGKEPSAAQLSQTVKDLKTGLEYAIDSLNDKTFRSLCSRWDILPGNLGNKTADTKVTGVDVDGGHYVLIGSKASLSGVTDKNIKKLVVPDTVTANGKTYKVTGITAGACMGLKKLTSVTLGKNVTEIGASAFAGCKKLKAFTINSKKLKKVGTAAVDGVKSSITFKCPKGKASKYEKLFRKNGGAPKKAKFK